MNIDKIQKLEKNDKFKKKIYNNDIWKNYAIVPPSGVVFIALFGLLYLYNLGQLVSLYALPFVLLMFLGAIWLKSTRKYLVDKKLESNDDFKICLSIPFLKNKGKTIWMFSTGKNRHNKHYLEKEKKEILVNLELGAYDERLLLSKKTFVNIPESDICLMIPVFSDRISNKNKGVFVNRYIVCGASGVIKFMTNRELDSFK